MIANEKLQGRSVQSVVETALAHLILRLGGLRVGIIDEDTNTPCFVHVPSMNLQDFIEWKMVTASNPAQQDDKVLEAMADRLEQLWPDIAVRPPWKLIVVQNKIQVANHIVLDMIFATHHALADGKSTAVFHTQLLRELNISSGPPQELDNHILRCTQPLILAPSQDELVQFTISWPYFLKLLWSDVLCPSWLKPTPPFTTWSGQPIAFEPHKLHTRLVAIKPENVARIIATCRTHGATLTAILHILVLTSLARHVPADAAVAFSGQTSVSLLPWAKLPPGVDIDLNSVLTDVNIGHRKVWDPETVAKLRFKLGLADDKAEEELIWPLAAGWRDDMKIKIATLPNDDSAGLLHHVSDWRKKWLDTIGKPRGTAWSIANIGSMSGVGEEGSGDWSIRRACFTSPAQIVGSAIGISVAGIEGGEVTLILTWQDTIVDKAVADGIVEDLCAWFQEFEKMGRFGIFSREN